MCIHKLIILCCSCILVAFHEACSLGLADVVEAFLECNGNDLITTRDGNGLNALQIATMNKRNLVVQILLRRLLMTIIEVHNINHYAVVC